MHSPLSISRPPAQLPEVRAYLERHRDELRVMLEAPATSGIALARRHSKVMDGLLSALYPAAFAAAQQQRKKWPPVLLAAVGGYGRQRLAWKSDLDVRILTTDSPERLRPVAESILYPLWDAGVSIGHQVITISDAIETARRDLPTATALLDSRALAGDPAVGAMLEEKAFAALFNEGELPRFMRRLEEEASERHRRFGDSVYLLEPDVKNGEGGLRDLDIALWAARARFRTADLIDLLKVGVLVAREAEEMRSAADFIWALRNHLHHRAGRRSDRLTFDEQEAIARAMGYHERVGAKDDSEAGAALTVEAFMSDYYRHARVVTRLREQVVARATPRQSRRKPRIADLGHGLRTFDGQLTFADPGRLGDDPAVVLRLYATAVSTGKTVLPFARDVVARSASDPAFAAALRASSEAPPLFVQLVSTARPSPFKNGSILGELHEVGLLTAMIPEFLPVVGRVHHDVYHVYTVDVHSVAAVDRLRALVRGELTEENPLACRLAAEITRPSVLFLATLLHDVGKAIGGEDHSKRGAHVAETILSRLGLPREDVQSGCHLILQHLLMYRIAAHRDLEDTTTVAEFARQVQGREGLRDLYLLTVADLSTTSPTSMTKWKARMLDELYLAADRLLSGVDTSDAARLERVRREAHLLAGPELERAFLDEYMATMPERYLLSNTPEEVVAHAEVALRARCSAVTAALVPSRHPDVAELCVVVGDAPPEPGLCVITKDRPGLLAAITAAIAANGFEVHAAEIHSRPLGDGGVQAVDVFFIRSHLAGGEGVEKALPKLEGDLKRVLLGEVSARDLVKRRSSSRWSERPSPNITTEVVIDNRASSRYTVIEVLTKDRPGVLFALAETLHQLGLSIAVAKINTEGTKVVDVFYVTTAEGAKLDVAHAEAARRSLLATLSPAPPREARAG
ncbi:MAG TPA: [protein-PII] uridylyltransferase [Polyangiaceae bacterium]|nr:[protein-PII] uridylyltransferase [Polyangiaceae bacterium]